MIVDRRSSWVHAVLAKAVAIKVTKSFFMSVHRFLVLWKTPAAMGRVP